MTSGFSERFVKLMRERRGSLYYFRWSEAASGFSSKENPITYLRRYLQKYEQTGEASYLVDVANMAMIEFVDPVHYGDRAD